MLSFNYIEGQNNEREEDMKNIVVNTCKECGVKYETEDVFAEVFGEVAPANSDHLCPECSAKLVESQKDLPPYPGP